MSLDTYANLQASIISYLKRTDLSGNVQDFITLCETMLNRKFIGMNPPPYGEEATQTGNLVVASTPPALLALPAGYMGMKRFQLQIPGDFKALKYKTPQQMATYQCSGNPEFYTTNGANIEIAAPPDSTYAYVWTYYKSFTPLSDSNTSNWVLVSAPDLYLYGSLIQAEPFMKNDKRITTWAAFLANGLTDFELANNRNRQSGSTLQVRSDAAIP